MAGAEGTKIFDFDNARSLERLFREKNYIESYFYLLKSTKSTKTASQKYWRNIVWVDFFWRPYHANGIKTRLGSPVLLHSRNLSQVCEWNHSVWVAP